MSTKNISRVVLGAWGSWAGWRVEIAGATILGFGAREALEDEDDEDEDEGGWAGGYAIGACF